MKKTIIIFIMLVATIAAGNAQLFVEGSFSVSHNESKSSNGDNNNTSSNLFIHVSPKVGYWINDDFTMGIMTSYSTYFSKNITNDQNNPDQEIVNEYRTPEWRFSIFGRYKLLKKEKFSLLAESSMGYGKSINKEKTESITKKGNLRLFLLLMFSL